MTRLARYQLLSCPMCSTVYKHPLYSSVSVYVPHDLNPRLDRICTNCGFRAELDRWEDVGTVETCTDEESTRQNAAVMHMLGIGPPPPKLPLIQRIRETLFGRPKSIDPSEKYPPIEIAQQWTGGFYSLQSIEFSTVRMQNSPREFDLNPAAK